MFVSSHSLAKTIEKTYAEGAKVTLITEITAHSPFALNKLHNMCVRNRENKISILILRYQCLSY